MLDGLAGAGVFPAPRMRLVVGKKSYGRVTIDMIAGASLSGRRDIATS